MGKNKNKKIKRVNSLTVEEENTRSKRNEVETTSYKSNQKDVNKNQVEDKNDCKKSVTEGIHFSTTDNEKETKKNKLESNKKNEDKKKKEQKTESLNENGNIVLDVSESICNYSVEEKDLFKLSTDISLAFCVEENFQMETPISSRFKNIVGDVNKLMEQNLKVGEVGLVVNRHNQNTFYMITQKSGSNKSKNKTIKKAFTNILNKMTNMNITNLGVAKINFEEEGYSWSAVKKCITDVFAKSGIHVTVCIPSKKSDQPSEDSFSDNKQTQNEYEVSAFDNESNQYAIKNSSQQCDTSKNKKGKKSRDQQNVDKNTKFDNNKFKHTSDSILEEIDQDLFKLSDEYCLAHCVAEDLRMGAGIAVEFKRQFGGVGKLIDQNLKVGNVGMVKRHNQFAFYLITKKNSSGKPTMQTMEMALRSLLDSLKQYKLMKLGIPRIGCGLDGLDWDDVKSLILQIFSESGIHITVCVPSKQLDRKAPPPLRVYITPKNLWEMETETVIIMPINLEQVHQQNWSYRAVDEVNSRYPFKENMLKDVKQIIKQELNPGAIKHYKINGENLVCVFFQPNKLYSSLEDSFKKVLSLLKPYVYLAIQSGSIADNYKHIAWIVLILRSISNSNQCELWLCGDANQTDIKVPYDQYCGNLRYSIDRPSKYFSTSQGRSSLSSQQPHGISSNRTDLFPPIVHKYKQNY